MSGAADLSDFLLARIAEDESDAVNSRHRVVNDEFPRGAYEFRISRAKAECESKRRILGAHPHLMDADDSVRGCSNCPPGPVAPRGSYCLTMRSLSVPYADHPDYREEWRP